MVWIGLYCLDRIAQIVLNGLLMATDEVSVVPPRGEFQGDAIDGLGRDPRSINFCRPRPHGAIRALAPWSGSIP